MKCITVGGSKGHIVETIEGSLFQLYSHYRWKMISNCTGRYTCREHCTTNIKPLELIQNAGIEILLEKSVPSSTGNENDDEEQNHHDSDKKVSSLKQWEFRLPGRPDRLLIVPLDDQNTIGVITYEKLNNNINNKEDDKESTNRAKYKYVHTLNTISGFRRKLNAVGIEVTDDSIYLSNQ